MFRKFVVLGSLCGVLVSSPAFSEEKKEEGKAESVIKLCPALADEKTYAKEDDFRFIVAGKDTWIFRTDMDLNEDLELSEFSVSSFKRLQQAFKQHGTELAVTMMPTRGIVGHEHLLPPYSEKYNHAKAKEAYGKMLDSLKEAGLIVADLKDVDAQANYFLKRDNHWTAEGAKYSAQRMADAIKALPVYETLRKTSFETTASEPGEDDEANDRFLDFIKDVCGEKPPIEDLPAVYNTAPVKTGDSGTDLLGESAQPEIVLFGTSNSTVPDPSYANFIGYLKEYLSVDISNESISGGSFRGAIANYIFSGKFHEQKPKIAVWELSAHYGFEQKATFRELIAGLSGECADDTAVSMKEGTVESKETVLFDGLEKAQMVGQDYYLYLELEDKTQRDIQIDFVHAGGTLDKLKLERSKKNFPETNGKYFAELNNGIDQPVQSIKLRAKNGSGKFKAKMCKASQPTASSVPTE